MLGGFLSNHAIYLFKLQASIYESLKQVVPWRRRQDKQKKMVFQNWHPPILLPMITAAHHTNTTFFLYSTYLYPLILYIIIYNIWWFTKNPKWVTIAVTLFQVMTNVCNGKCLHVCLMRKIVVQYKTKALQRQSQN